MAMSDEERYAWLRLTLEPGVGPVTARHLLVAFGLPQDIFGASASALMKVVPQKQALQLTSPVDPAIDTLIKRTFDWLARPNHHIITLADEQYPALLLDTSDPPPLLYVDGDPAVLSRPGLAVVGARSATPAGTDNAFAFARHLAQAGWGIISGLAQGIDGAAHEGALASGEPLATIAVMGTGINRVYPAAHKELAMRIRERGALVTELPLDTPAVVHQFPLRNRIVTGLSRGVLVVEAAKRSGSLITARLAAENGREVFAIPGSIHSPLSRGCHALIRQGAKLVETAEDIIEELSRNGSVPQTSSISPAGTTIVASVTSRGEHRPQGEPGGRGEQGSQNVKRSRSGKLAVARGQNRSPRLATDSTNFSETMEPLDTAETAEISNKGDAQEAGSSLASRHSGASKNQSDITDPEQRALLDQMGFDPVSLDLLLLRLNITVAELAGALTELEMLGKIVRLPDGRYLQRGNHLQ